jgi:hypothetical protein
LILTGSSDLDVFLRIKTTGSHVLCKSLSRSHAAFEPDRKPLPRLEPVAVELKGSISETAREYAAEAIGTVVSVMRDRKATEPTRAACAMQILDRGWGRPVAATKGDAMGDKPQDTRQVSDLDLTRWILSGCCVRGFLPRTAGRDVDCDQANWCRALRADRKLTC